VRVASTSGRPQLDDEARCAATPTPHNSLLMKIIPDSGAFWHASAAPPSAETGSSWPVAHPDCLMHPRLTMSTGPDMTSLHRTCRSAQPTVIWQLRDIPVTCNHLHCRPGSQQLLNGDRQRSDASADGRPAAVWMARPSPARRG